MWVKRMFTNSHRQTTYCISLVISLVITSCIYEGPSESSNNCHVNHIRGLGFKFVDFLCKRSDVCHTEIEML